MFYSAIRPTTVPAGISDADAAVLATVTAKKQESRSFPKFDAAGHPKISAAVSNLPTSIPVVTLPSDVDAFMGMQSTLGPTQ